MAKGLSKETVLEIDKYMPFLSYSTEGELKISGTSAHGLATAYGTPSILYLEDRLLDNYQAVHNAFCRYFREVRTFFALKSCYLSPCVQALRSAGANIEVMSDIELQIALLNGFTPQQVITNGVGRDEAYIELSLNPPVHLNIIDCLEDLIALQGLAARRGVVADIGLRVIPPVAAEGAGMMIKKSSKLGMDWGGDLFLGVLKSALGMANIRVRAILVHQLSHAQSITQYAAVMSAAAKVIREIWEQTGHRFEIVDIGGGFDTRFLLESQGITISDFASEAWRQLSTIPYSFALHIEPGRYIVADAGLGLTRIITEKHNEELSWRISDISSNVLIPLPDIAYYPVPTRLPKHQEWAFYNVGDRTCAPSIICAQALLPSGPEGRELVLLNCGGYTTVFAELWAFELPRILFMNRAGDIQELFGHAQFLEMVKHFYGYDLSNWGTRATGSPNRFPYEQR
jgi:diaminopimelate decarboxylase